MIDNLINFGKMVKFSHTLFALPFALLSVILGLKTSTIPLENFIYKFLLILVCMVSARNAAMGFNRLVDADIDAKNPRTKNREVPAGILKKRDVGIFTILFIIVFIFSTYFLNSFSFYASLPTLFIILGYSYTKRITWFCHYILGIGIGLAPSAAWVALLNEISFLPILFSLGLMFHIAGFDILYSLQDYKFDEGMGLYSIPSRFGIQKSLYISRFNHLLSFSILIYAGIYGNMNLAYFLFVSIAGILFLAEHLMVKPDDLSKIPIAFFHINASISSVLFLGILADNWIFLLDYFRG